MKASEILGEAAGDNRAGSRTAREVGRKMRPRLTIRHIRRLRLMQELKKLEAAEKQKFVSNMYGGNFEESDEKEKDIFRLQHRCRVDRYDVLAVNNDCCVFNNPTLLVESDSSDIRNLQHRPGCSWRHRDSQGAKRRSRF